MDNSMEMEMEMMTILDTELKENGVDLDQDMCDIVETEILADDGIKDNMIVRSKSGN